MNGKLKLVGNQLSSECGNAVQLRGMSTHGMQWYGNCINNSAFTSLKNNWNADVVRLAMYVDEGGYLTDPSGYKAKIDAWIDQIGALGMYCLIDWHSLNPGDPNAHTTEAKDFWNYISLKHKGKKHLLYEICNEPNGVTWGTIKNFANQIIPVIRANDPETIIIVGTPQWSGKPGDVVSGGPLTSPNAYNVMYTFHFYASSHASYRPEVQRAAGSIPIFATEWGLSDASGGGSLNMAEGQLWMDIFNGNNDGKQKISWCNWSFSDKGESSAALNSGSCAGSNWTNTTPSGTQVKTWISSPAKNFISCTSASVVSCSISAPLNNSAFNQGSNITFTSSASTTSGNISKIEFFEGTTLLGTATNSPFTISISTLTTGSHIITAKATDSNGSSVTSTPVTIKINSSVVTSAITAPANNSSSIIGSSVNISASASTTNGIITKIEFYVDNILTNTDVTSPYQYSTATNLGLGNHTISIKAYDSNNSLDNQSITITIINSPLTVSLTSPTNSDYSLGSDFLLSANAAITGGTISKVEFYIDAVLVNSDPSSPYSYTASGLSAGNHTIYAKAYDSNNNTAVTSTKIVNLLTPVYKVANAPVIDGTIDGIWTNASIPSSILGKTITGTISGSSDLSGSFKTLWDNNYLYVLGDITDDVKINDSPEAYNDDAVEVYMDVNNDKSTTIGANDAQYTFGWNDGTTIATSPTGRTTTGMSYIISNKVGGYIFEARIPWSALSANPVIGQKLGFDFMINDDDDGGTRDSKISWNSLTDKAYQDPSLLGTVILMDALPCPLPANTGNILGNPTICAQSSGQVFSISSVTNANNYNWVLPAGYSITSGQNTTVITVSLNAVATSGQISVTPTNSCGAGQASLLAIKVNPLPNVTISATKSAVCQGDPVTLTGTGASTYVFDNSVKNGVSFVPDQTKNYNLTGTDQNGCQNISSTNILVNTRPTAPSIITPTPLCNNNSVPNDFSVSSSIKTSVYNWTASNSTNITGQNSSKASITFKTGLTSADVTVTETNNFNCTGPVGKQTVFFTVCTLSGIQENETAEQLRIFPNPFQSNINVSLGNLVNETTKLELTDIEGNLVDVREGNLISDQYSIGENLQAGQYILRIISSNKVIVRSVVKIQ
ncbi:MAG: cellulase family glycosylhydrolase [Opitutaceae bacterium]|nr:cellulase family glycosylhydrolase [Cytophagales bacterium]